MEQRNGSKAPHNLLEETACTSAYRLARTSVYVRICLVGLPSKSFTLLCHSETLWGFCLSMTELSSSGRREMRNSRRSSLHGIPEEEIRK